MSSSIFFLPMIHVLLFFYVTLLISEKNDDNNVEALFFLPLEKMIGGDIYWYMVILHCYIYISVFGTDSLTTVISSPVTYRKRFHILWRIAFSIPSIFADAFNPRDIVDTVSVKKFRKCRKSRIFDFFRFFTTC